MNEIQKTRGLLREAASLFNSLSSESPYFIGVGGNVIGNAGRGGVKARIVLP